MSRAIAATLFKNQLRISHRTCKVIVPADARSLQQPAMTPN